MLFRASFVDNSRGLGGVLWVGIGLCVALNSADLHASALPRSSRSGTIPLMLDQFFSVVPMPVFIIVVLVGFHFLKKTFMRRRGQKLGVTSSPSSDITPGTLAKVDTAEWKQLNEHHTKGDRIDFVSIHKHRCTTYSSWEESPLWERELDNKTHKRIQMRSRLHLLNKEVYL